jgi:E3 ubiquitin-protein ligase UBR1
MGPCTSANLMKRVTERLVEDVSFERELKKIMTFKPPESATDSGMYGLGGEGYDDVGPFFVTIHGTNGRRWRMSSR